MKRALIKYSQQGWIVYPDHNPEEFYLFKSNEPEKLVKFLCERIAGIKIDQIIQARNEEMATESRKLHGNVNG